MSIIDDSAIKCDGIIDAEKKNCKKDKISIFYLHFY